MGYTEATAGFLQSGSTVIQVNFSGRRCETDPTLTDRLFWPQYWDTVLTDGDIGSTTLLWPR